MQLPRLGKRGLQTEIEIPKNGRRGEELRLIEAELSRRRDHSRSLSSIASGSLHDDVTHERQPLLTLRRQPPDASMGAGTIDEDANRVVESIVEQDLEELLRLKNMEEIEELYGMPVIVGPYSGFHDFTHKSYVNSANSSFHLLSA